MFQVAARTLLQLGAELISSDAIAFYELIKNGFDAGSPRVDVEFLIRIPSDRWEDCIVALNEPENTNRSKCYRHTSDIRSDLLLAVDAGAPQADVVRNQLRNARTHTDLHTGFAEANRIAITDKGSGMSLDTLRTAYLTIGTRYRREERAHAAANSSVSRLTLGEKGVGRLSVMRLGSQLMVLTTRSGDTHWHMLRIDWDQISHDSDALVESVKVELGDADQKDDPSLSGTQLHIWGLRHAWSLRAVEDLARSEFSRFADPFAERRPFRLSIAFNENVVPIPRFDRLLFDAAHAHMTAHFDVGVLNGGSLSDGPSLSGAIDYRVGHAKKEFSEAAFDLASIAQVSSATLRSIGPFKLDLYWFNRRLLSAIEGVGDVKLVRDLLNRWGGGVAIYRDGFRVNPYGGPDDDWLDLDKDAFRAPGYKLNRNQIIAKISITALENPHFLDQTNREGLQKNAQYSALRALVKHVLEVQLRSFLDLVDEKNRIQSLQPLEVLQARTETARDKVQAALGSLARAAPVAVDQTQIADRINELVDEIQRAFEQTRERLAANEQERERLVLLAANGLIVEIIAHELHRATAHTLSMVTDAARDPRLVPARAVLDSLGSQLKTLRTRLSVLDEVSVSGRQVKSDFDLVYSVRTIVENHQPQFDRHGIVAKLAVHPTDGELRVKMVRGMVVQILENLFSNAVYWLDVARRENPGFTPEIRITVDRQERTVSVTDNGPGIELSRAEDVFLPYVTTKPPGEGRGLGLYIAREVAEYNGGSLRLSTESVTHPGRLNTFVLRLGRAAA